MNVDDLQNWDYVDNLTDVSLTPMQRVQIFGIVKMATPDERQQIAKTIDRTCYFVLFSDTVALGSDRQCGLEDWHALAKEIREGLNL